MASVPFLSVDTTTQYGVPFFSLRALMFTFRTWQQLPCLPLFLSLPLSSFLGTPLLSLQIPILKSYPPVPKPSK
jgi:hypothetical protein